MFLRIALAFLAAALLGCAVTVSDPSELDAAPTPPTVAVRPACAACSDWYAGDTTPVCHDEQGVVHAVIACAARACAIEVGEHPDRYSARDNACMHAFCGEALDVCGVQ